MGFLKQIIQLFMSGRHGGYGGGGMVGHHGGSKHGGYGNSPAGYPPAPAPGQSATTRTDLCSKCGIPNPASARFCAECGASLAGGPCSGCGVELESGAKFCGRCGMRQ